MTGYYGENIRTKRVSGKNKTKDRKIPNVGQHERGLLNRERQTIARAVHLDRLVGRRQKWQHHDMQNLCDDNM